MKKIDIVRKIIIYTLSVMFVFLYSFLSLKYYGISVFFNHTVNLGDYFQFTWSFLLSMVIPVMAIFGLFFYFYFKPLEKILNQLNDRESVSEETLEKAKRILIRFPVYIIIFNIIGYFLVHITDVINTGRLTRFFTVHELSWFVFIMTSSGIYSFVQITIINQILAKPRELLNIHHFKKQGGINKVGLRVKNIILFTLLAVYSFAFFVRFSSLFFEKEIYFSSQMSLYQTGKSTLAEITDNYKDHLLLLIDQKVDKATIRLPEINDLSRTGGYAMFFILSSLCLLGIGFLSMYLFSKELVTQIRTQTDTIKSILDGDKNLSSYISITEFDEVGQLTDYINQLMGSLREILRKVQDGSLSVSGSSEIVNQRVFSTTSAVEEMVASIKQITTNTSNQMTVIDKTKQYLEDMLTGIDKISVNIEGQVTFVTETATAMQEIASNTASVNEITMKTNEVSNNLIITAKDGGESVTKAMEAIKMIEDSSNKVLEIIEVLSTLSSQTNLLAMNAAIEAAHAQEFGKGFAVVADEIRRLAEDSSRHAKEISDYIKEMYDKIKNGVRMSEEAGLAFQKINNDIGITSSLIREIKNAMNEQKAGTDEILASVSSVVNASYEVKNIASDLKTQSQTIRDSMQDLSEVSHQINDATDEQNNVNKEIVSLINSVKDVSGNNIETVNKLMSIVKGYNLS